MSAMHPLAPADGERVFVVPAEVQAACKAALAATKTGEAHAFAFAIAEHLAAGEPVGVSTAKRLQEVLTDLDDASRVELAKARALMGGARALAWTSRELAKDGGGTFVASSKVLKVDDDLGVVFGWALVCQEDGEDYFDVQGDHIPEDAMLKAATDFMCNSRVLGDMHEKKEGGSVVFAFPLTAEVAKAFGLETKTTGLMIGVKPASEDTLTKFKDGTYTGFSIGGRRVKDEAA